MLRVKNHVKLLKQVLDIFLKIDINMDLYLILQLVIMRYYKHIIKNQFLKKAL